MNGEINYKRVEIVMQGKGGLISPEATRTISFTKCRVLISGPSFIIIRDGETKTEGRIIPIESVEKFNLYYDNQEN